MTAASTRVPADLAALGAVRSRLAEALARERWSDDAASRVLTASTEALVNALEHGSAPGARVGVAFTVTEQSASVRVRDGGCGRPAPVPEPARPPATSTHGRGALLMQALADEMLVSHRGDGTEVRLAFGRDS
jgi:anti-sigma regulatory factor (Ser/Thr protein kinase)